VAKYIMPTGAVLAMFNGGGMSLADDLLKNHAHFLIEDDGTQSAPNLEGLSCRWKPISARRGTMLTLLVMSRSTDTDSEIYRDLNAFIEQTLGANQNPVHNSNLFYKWPTFEALRQSQMVWRQGNMIKNLFGHIFLITLFNIMNRFSLSLPDLNVPEYKKDMIVNSDYRKFDDMLRMVIDCSEKQAQDIESHLNKMYNDHKIIYGIHYSDTALMTCFVESLQKESHVHFIDGNDGGYALAAIDMKERLNQVIEKN